MPPSLLCAACTEGFVQCNHGACRPTVTPVQSHRVAQAAQVMPTWLRAVLETRIAAGVHSCSVTLRAKFKVPQPKHNLKPNAN